MLLEHANQPIFGAPCRDTRFGHDGKPNIINWLLAVATIGCLIHDD
jgi:hypothetical protein